MNDFAVHERGVLHDALLSRVIHVYQPELFRKVRGKLSVIEQRPVEVTEKRHALTARPQVVPQVVAQERGPLPIMHRAAGIRLVCQRYAVLVITIDLPYRSCRKRGAQYSSSGTIA